MIKNDSIFWFWSDSETEVFSTSSSLCHAFGDIFKNAFPQHLWHFWKPSKYFSVPAQVWISGCLLLSLMVELVVNKSRPIDLFCCFTCGIWRKNVRTSSPPISHTFLGNFRIFENTGQNVWRELADRRHFPVKLSSWFFEKITWNRSISRNFFDLRPC